MNSLMKKYSIPDEFVDICFQEAEKGLSKKEVPVGCVYVRVFDDEKKPEIIVKDHNRTNEYKSALKHAEMNCLREVIVKYPNNYDEIMKEIVVILTLEPCIMCCRMLRGMQVKAIIFGACNDRFGGAGSVYPVHNHDKIPENVVDCVSELDPERAIKVLQDFYDQTNENAPKKKELF